jgi:ADP-heptose:LPS heptosyltransferase
MPYAAHSILAIDMSPFGHSLGLLPAMRALRISYPQTSIVAAAPSGTCELLTACGIVDETIGLGVIKSPNRGNAGALKRFLSLIRHSRRYNFDLVLDFSPRLETQIVSRLILRAHTFTPSKLPRSIDLLLDLGGMRRPAGHTATSDYANVLRQAGVEMDDQRLGITLPVEEDGRFERRLAASGSRGGELIALLYASNPGSLEGWPAASFGEIGTRLVNNFAARIIVSDEPSDQAFTAAVSPLLPPGAIKLVAPRALELVASIARASIVITDEAAIATIASELNTPVIEIADTMSRSTPSSPAHRIAKGSSRERVSTDEVYDTTCEVIQESRSHSLFQRP